MSIYWIMQPETGIGDMIIYNCSNKIVVDNLYERQQLLNDRLVLTQRCKDRKQDNVRYWRINKMIYLEFPSDSKDDVGRIRLVGLLFKNENFNNVKLDELKGTIFDAAKVLSINLSSEDYLARGHNVLKKTRGCCGIILGFVTIIVSLIVFNNFVRLH